MNKSDDYKDSKQGAYLTQVLDELSQVRREKRPPSTQQAASTLKNMARTDEERRDYWNSPTLNWKAVPDAKSTDEAVGWKDRDLTLISQVEATRRRPKNSIGQSEESSASKERKEAGINALTYSPPAQLTEQEKAKVTEMSGYTPPPPPVEEPKPRKQWFQGWFKRGEPVATASHSDETKDFLQKLARAVKK